MSATKTPPTEMALRPDGGGREGRRIEIRANFFAIPQVCALSKTSVHFALIAKLISNVTFKNIQQLPVDTIWHYDVAITPEIPPEKARRVSPSPPQKKKSRVKMRSTR